MLNGPEQGMDQPQTLTREYATEAEHVADRLELLHRGYRQIHEERTPEGWLVMYEQVENR